MFIVTIIVTHCNHFFFQYDGDSYDNCVPIIRAEDFSEEVVYIIYMLRLTKNFKKICTLASM